MNREEYYAAIQQYQENSLEHHGILGQKWGIRRYQNPDGSYTEAGKKRYGIDANGDSKSARKMARRLNDLDQAMSTERRFATSLTKKHQRLSEKVEKYNDKGKEEKAAKYEKKAAKIKDKADKYLSEVEKGNKETQQILNKIKESGAYRVKMRDTIRNTTTFGDLFKPYFWDIKISRDDARIAGYHFTSGTRYKVKAK